MRCGLFLPPFNELADPRVVADLAATAENSGWDGFFLWDHVVRSDDSMPVADPWIALAAIACATNRVTIGALVTPLARRRPQIVARQTTTLDQLSGGRLVVGVGLGNDNGRELSAFGEETSDRERATLLDESLDVLAEFWSGDTVTHHGRVVVDGVSFAPRPVQQPRIPIWVGGRWPNRRPLQRALRYDGYMPDPQSISSAADVRAITEHIPADGFDLVIGTPSTSSVAEFADAGATWWLASLYPQDPIALAQQLAADGPPR